MCTATLIKQTNQQHDADAGSSLASAGTSSHGTGSSTPSPAKRINTVMPDAKQAADHLRHVAKGRYNTLVVFLSRGGAAELLCEGMDAAVTAEVSQLLRAAEQKGIKQLALHVSDDMNLLPAFLSVIHRSWELEELTLSARHMACCCQCAACKAAWLGLLRPSLHTLRLQIAPSIAPVIKIFQGNMHLAPGLRYLDLVTCQGEHSLCPELQRLLAPSDAAAAGQGLEHLSVSITRGSGEEVEVMPEDMMPVLQVCPNLKSLRIPGAPLGYNVPVSISLLGILRALPLLTSLMLGVDLPLLPAGEFPLNWPAVPPGGASVRWDVAELLRPLRQLRHLEVLETSDAVTTAVKHLPQTRGYFSGLQQLHVGGSISGTPGHIADLAQLVPPTCHLVLHESLLSCPPHYPIPDPLASAATAGTVASHPGGISFAAPWALSGAL